MRGADGVKIAILRKGRANLTLIWAAAHAQRYLVNDKGGSNEEDTGNIVNGDFFIISCSIGIRQIISGCQLHNHRKNKYAKY